MEAMVYKDDSKVCTVCHERKPLDAFYRNPATYDRRQNKCKECAKAYQRTWYRDNRDYVSRYMREHYQVRKYGRVL